ncbi:MAG: APC family permease [Planctomycetes bacterium]|nr:APC family permease [Planctomycetota bacterium]
MDKPPEPTPPSGDSGVTGLSPAPPGEAQRTPLSHILLGRPKDPHEEHLFHRLSLIPFLAWIGLGADGLSSSAYGPEVAFKTLGEHTYLAVPLAALTAVTVVVISACYMRLIEVFPHGGGGYLVAMKLLGQRPGIVAGCALLVDYVLTITVSIAAAGDALFSLEELRDHQGWKLPAEVAAIVTLMFLNLRGVRESVLVLAPIFITFLLTHAALIVSGCVVHAGDLPKEAGRLADQLHSDLAAPGLGWAAMLLLFLRAYSLGGGTYTGIEAVSNGLAVMRAPQVQTGKRTMVYMAASLSFTAAGLILCYLLAGVRPVGGQTMNAVLTADVLGKCFPDGPGLQKLLLFLTLAAEGALLVIAAQAGFIGGPRIMANMAVDSYLPHRFAALSDRFTTSNGIILMSVASLAALAYTGGDVEALVLMYSINVFLTFSLAMLGMMAYWWQARGKDPLWKRRTALFAVGFAFCAVILGITVYEKFLVGGWVTLAVTGALVAICLGVKGYYRRVGRKIAQLQTLLEVPPEENVKVPPFNPELPTAVVLVNFYGGLGIHTILKVIQNFPGYFKGFHFISVGTIDSGNFKGTEEIQALERNTEDQLRKYVELANGLGFPARYSFSIGTEPVDELERLCTEAASQYRTVTFFSGKLLFEREKWYHVLFHNMTAYALQKRLQWAGLMMVILPVRIFGAKGRG